MREWRRQGRRRKVGEGHPGVLTVEEGAMALRFKQRGVKLSRQEVIYSRLPDSGVHHNAVVKSCFYFSMAWITLASCILRVRDFHADAIVCLAKVVICSRGFNCAVEDRRSRRATDGSGLRDLHKAVE